MMWYIYALLGILIRRQAFEVNNGNDDWMDLVHPEKYGLTETQNFYMQVSNITSTKPNKSFLGAGMYELF